MFGQVLKRVWKLSEFGLKKGKGLGKEFPASGKTDVLYDMT